MVTPNLIISKSKKEVVSRGLDVCSESLAAEIKRSETTVYFENKDSPQRNMKCFDKRYHVGGFVVPNRIVKVCESQNSTKDEICGVKDLDLNADGWNNVSNSNITFDVIKGTEIHSSSQTKILIDDAASFHDEKITLNKDVPRENLCMGQIGMSSFICDHNQSISSSSGDNEEDISDRRTMFDYTILQQGRTIVLGDNGHLKQANQRLLEESNSQFSAVYSNSQNWNPSCHPTRVTPTGILKSMPQSIMGKENKEALDFLQSPQLSSRSGRGGVQLFLDQKPLLLGGSKLNLSPASDQLTSSARLSYSGSNSYRSESSTTSTHSFAFPVLQAEWNSSPVKMPHTNCRSSRRKGGGWRMRFLCFKF